MDRKYSILDYFAFRSDITFEERPVNEIDIMMFACLGKPDYTGVFPENTVSMNFRKAYEKYKIKINYAEKVGLLESDIFMESLDVAAASKRFENIKISFFVNKVVTENTEQLSALTVEGPDGITYVTFRGTDDTIIGWKENCDLAIMEEVPAQRDAVAYLEFIASCYDGPIAVLGHSKGGNLAVHAAAKASKSVRDRIKFVYSYDGPGFMPGFLGSEGYREIKDRIITYVPYASIIGMIMSPAGKINVIACEDEGPHAHDVYLWNLGIDRFIHLNDISTKSKVFHQAMSNTLAKMDIDDRKNFVEELFSVLFSTGASTLMDLSENSFEKALMIAEGFKKSDEVKKFVATLMENSIKLSALEKLEEELDEFSK